MESRKIILFCDSKKNIELRVVCKQIIINFGRVKQLLPNIPFRSGLRPQNYGNPHVSSISTSVIEGNKY